MYPHHERALESLKAYFSKEPGVIAVIFGGSVAKGLERPDSDIDAMVIVTDERYEESAKPAGPGHLRLLRL